MVATRRIKIQKLLYSLAIIVSSAFVLLGQSVSVDFGNYPKHYAIGSVAIEQIDLQWRSADVQNFTWSGRYASRTSSEQHGVTSPDLHFTIKGLTAGFYCLQFSMDAAMDDSLKALFYVNDYVMDLDAQTFKVPGEPYQSLKPQFRVLQYNHLHNGKDLAIRIVHPSDSVRLLQMKILPLMVGASAKEAWIKSLIDEVGRYQGRHLPLGEILWQLENHKRPNWSEYWLQQLSMLHRAEELFALKGWEWARKMDGLTLISRSQQIAMLLDPLTKDPAHPLFERALALQSKVLFHLNLEYGGEHEYHSAQAGLSTLAVLYPQDTILSMYLGNTYRSSEVHSLEDDAAPAWAQWQLSSMKQLRKLVHYWVTERQAPNGEFGGKLGDDVEALRFWEPLIYSGDSLAILGWSRLYEGVWNSTHIHEGYAKRVADVEHAAEFISDTEPAMMIISDDKMVHDRALSIYHHFDSLWSGINQQGHRLFKSAWYSSTAIDTIPPRNRDVDYNARAMKALRYYLYRYPEHQDLASIMNEWSGAWVAVAKSTAKGKPAGILPPSIAFPSGSINGEEDTWWKANMLWEYFDFKGASLMLDQLLFMYWMSSNEQLLEPLQASLDLVTKYNDRQEEESTPGSALWASQQYRASKHWWSIASQYRLLTGDKTYDHLFKEHGSGYLKFLILDNPDALQPELEVMHKALTTNWPMLTTESIYTDRIYGYYDDGYSRLETNVLKAMLTGDMCLWGTSPYMAVTWRDLAEECSVLVDKDESRLNIKIYNHGRRSVRLKASLWHLNEGEYQLSVENQAIEKFKVSNVDAHTPIEISAKTGLSRINIQRIN